MRTPQQETMSAIGKAREQALQRQRSVRLRRWIVCHIAAVLFSFLPAMSDSLIFTESPFTITDLAYPGWDHVGLEVDGWVIESHPGYEYRGMLGLPLCWNGSGWSLVLRMNGVQYQHCTGSFVWNASDPAQSGNSRWSSIPISDSLGAAMASNYIWYDGSPYPPAPLLVLNHSASYQKGFNEGGYMTCVGLVERLAEDAGVNGGDGFAPRWLEALCELNPAIGLGSLKFCPQLLYACVTESGAFSRVHSYLTGYFDPVDFIVTDPQGRRIACVTGVGTVNEIPDAYYAGSDMEEQFIILNPLSGQYEIRLYGLGQPVKVLLTSSSQTYRFEGQLGAGEVRVDGFQLDAGAAPILTVRLVDEGVEVSWQTLSGFTYSLQRCSNLVSAHWVPVAGHQGVVGNGSWESFIEPCHTAAFYRLTYEACAP